MSQEMIVLLLVAGISVQHLAEAWLEAVVIALKDPRLAEGSLNDQEHARSLVYSIIAAAPYGAIALSMGFIWLLGAFLVNRRLIFDNALKGFRRPRRPLGVYERKKGIDAFLARIFGQRGALIEAGLEAAATAAFVIIQLSTL